MSNEELNDVDTPVMDSAEEEVELEAMPDELTLLKQRAATMGIKHHPSIGLDKLKVKIKDFQTAAEKDNAKEARKLANQREEEVSENILAQSKVSSYSPKEETKIQRKMRLRKEASRLIRIRVVNMNPNKKEWEGDIFTVSNSTVGTFKKYIPYNNEEGWHVPQIILNHLKERKCQVFYNVKNNKGAKIRKGKLINELSIEILPDLTSSELKDLAHQQAQRHSID